MQFSLFNNLHLTVFLFLVISLVIVYYFRSNKQLKYILASVLITQVIIFNTKHLLDGTYDITRYLPLHLCTISAILAPIALLTKNKTTQDLVLFWGLIPALLAIILPDMNSQDGLMSFRFWEFFVSHIFIVLSAFYLSIHSSSKFSLLKLDTWRKITVSFLILIIVAFGIVYPINYLLNSNYMYIIAKASVGMDFLPSGSLYLPALLALSFVVFVLEAFLYNILNIFKK